MLFHLFAQDIKPGRDYGSWAFGMYFRYDELHRHILGNGTYAIRLAGNLGDQTGDLNIFKIARNYLDDVPLLSGGIVNTGDM